MSDRDIRPGSLGPNGDGFGNDGDYEGSAKPEPNGPDQGASFGTAGGGESEGDAEEGWDISAADAGHARRQARDQESNGRSHGHENQAGEGGDGAERGEQLPALSSPRAGPLARARETLPDASRGAFYGPEPDEVPLDFRKYLGIAFKHRWLIAGIATTVVALGLFYTLLQTPIYRGTASIEIKREVANISGVAGVEPVDAGRGSEFYQTQYELLKSRALAERIVSSIGLAQNDRFLEGTPSIWAKLGGTFLSTGRAQTTDIAQQQRRAVGLVMDGLSLEPVRSSSVVRIHFDSPDPGIAQQVANAAADSFIRSNLDRRFDATSYARKFLEERLQELKVNLEESEKTLVEYAEAQGILTTGDEQTVSMASLNDIRSALTAVEKDRVHHQTLWEQANAGEGGTLPQRLETEAIGKLRERRAELSAEYQDKLTIFKPEYPEMAHLRARIGEIDRQIEAEVGRIRESLRLQYEASLDEERQLKQRLSELSGDVMDYRNRNIQYTILKREVDTSRSLYEGLLQRYKEIGLAGGIDASTAANNVAFVDRAQRPGSPYTPNLKRNLALSLMLGLMFGGSAAFAREMLDDSFKGPEEVEEALGLPLLGVIPKSTEMADLQQALDDVHSAVGEAYRSLRTALQFSTASGIPKTLLVTSTQPGEGKSTASFAVAKNFAKLGLRVLLIDADLRKPSLHKIVGCSATPGLTNILVGSSSPPRNFQKLETPNLTFLPCGPLPPNPAELLAGARMASLLAVASEKFDLVIVDGPPVAGLADAPLLASLTEGTLLVIEAHQTLRKRVANALKRLHFAHAEVLGVVFNKFDVQRAGYGYGYGYGYGDNSYYGYGADTPEKLTDARDA